MTLAAQRPDARPLRASLRRLVFGSLMRTLALALSIGQVMIGHWLLVVVAGRPGPGWFWGLGLAALLMAANLLALPALRRARRGRGLRKRIAIAYMGLGVATLLLALAVGFSWLGLFPLSQLVAWIGVDAELAHQLFRIASVGLVGSLASMIAWGFTGGQARVDRSHVPIPLDRLHAADDGLRIAHLSDLHIGNGYEGERLEALVREVNESEPDVVVLTGDLFDFDPREVEGGARRLAALRARHGVYAVLGNHDIYTGADRVAGALAELAPGIRLLRGEIERLSTPTPLYIAGVDDPGSSQNWTDRGVLLDDLERLGTDLPKDGPVLLLVHRPEAFPQAARLGFDLVLAGHTHGGQIALPLPGGRINLARLVTSFDRGLYREGDSVLYVSRGIGVAGPAIRLGSDREIATLELRAT